MPYTKHSITLEKNARLFIYTDGITEATNSREELYGEERLLETLKQVNAFSSKEVLEQVQKDIDNFVQDAPQFDDITMLEMSFRGR